MFRKFAASALIAGSSIVGFAGIAQAQTTSPTVATATTKAPNPLKCVGAADHKTAQGLRLQALSADLAALNARLAAAQTANKPVAVARIQAHIAKVNARVAQVQANQIKLSTRCP